MTQSSGDSLWDACNKGLYDEVVASIAAGADVNASYEFAAMRSKDMRPLHIAVVFGHSRIVQALLEAGADVNATDSRVLVAPIAFAGRWHQNGILKMLVDAKADINAVACTSSRFGSTPMEMAAQAGKDPEVRAAISKYGGRFNTLLQAAQRGVAQDTDMKDWGEPLSDAGSVAAHIAEGKDVNALANTPIDDPDKPTMVQDLPLHAAANEGHSSIVEMLLDAKADVHAKDPNGLTAMERCKNNCSDNDKQEQVLAALSKHGAK